MFAASVASAVEAGMGLCCVVGVCAYPAYWGISASLVVVSKFLAVFALVGWACCPVLLNLVLSDEDADAIPEETFEVALVFQCYNT